MTYFDRLLAEKSGAFDVTSLLPPTARAFANTQKGVREAQAVAQDLGAGRRGIADSDAIVARLKERMTDAASLAAFPALQAGSQRAAAVDAALLQAATQLDGLERDVLKRVLAVEETAELQRAGRRPGPTSSAASRSSPNRNRPRCKGGESGSGSILRQSARRRSSSFRWWCSRCEHRPSPCNGWRRRPGPQRSSAATDERRSFRQSRSRRSWPRRSTPIDAQIGRDDRKELHDEETVNAGSWDPGATMALRASPCRRGLEARERICWRR